MKQFTQQNTKSRWSFLLSILILVLLCSSSPITKSVNTSSPVLIVFYNNCEKGLQQKLVNKITTFYKVPVKITTADLPGKAYYKPRNRYRADKLLIDLDHYSYSKVIGVTDQDISCTKGEVYDWGVFGLGSMSGKTGVISSYRLRRHKGSSQEIKNRIESTILHELGHTYGLEHCPNQRCLMADAEGQLKPEQNLTPWLCNTCWKKINIK
jgi:archaemetzincin